MKPSNKDLKQDVDNLYNNVRNMREEMEVLRMEFPRITDDSSYINIMQKNFGDKGFLYKINRAQTYDEIIALTKFYFHPEIATRLKELVKEPYNEDEEDPISLNSIVYFLRYCWRIGVRSSERPLITATPDGEIQGNWTKENGRYFILFCFDGETEIFIKTSGGSETKVDNINNLHKEPI